MAMVQLFYALEGIIILPIITKLMGAENYGVWIQLQVTITLAVSLLTLGLPYTLVRFLAGEKNKKNIQDGIWSSLALVCVISIIAAIILNIFSEPVAYFFGQKKIFAVLLAVILLFSGLNEILFNIFRAFQQIKKYAFFFIFQILAEIILVSLTLFWTHDILNAILSLLAARLLTFFIMISLVIKKIGVTIPRFLMIKDYLTFGLPLIPGNLATWIVQSSNRYLIGIFLGTVYVGYYAPANMLSNAIALFAAPLSFALPAKLSELYDGNRAEEVKKYLLCSLKYFLLLCIPSVFGLSVLSRPILDLFSTPEISQNSYYIVPFVALAMLFSGIYAIISQIISLLKKTHITSAIWLAASLANIGLNFLFIPKMGILGAAITTLITYALVLAATSYYVLRNFSVEIDWKFISKSFLAATIMSFFLIYFSPHTAISAIITIGAGALIYGVLIISFGGIDKKEIDSLKNIFKL